MGTLHVYNHTLPLLDAAADAPPPALGSGADMIPAVCR